MKTRLGTFNQLLASLLFRAVMVSLLFATQSANASNQIEQTPQIGADQSIVALINERLSYMKSVAASKWLANKQIEDLTRETQVLKSAARSGLDQNIKIASSTAFFSLQIEAAKEIQHYWFTQWRKSGESPTKPENLNTSIRPALIELGNAITHQLVNPNAAAQLNTHQIEAEGLSFETAEKLKLAALSIDTYDNALSRVLDSGILRVGTTFDYEPFSATDSKTSSAQESGQGSAHSSANATGIDIDMARDLAASLDAQLELVPTSWPNLMKDLDAGRFDIGMSGISINLRRHRTAYFSEPYLTGGKTPIVRCDDKEQYQSFDRINRAGVRVIVNPGGTNEKFSRANITNATLRIHNDNRTIFKEIINDKADVMFTDAIEVRVQSKRHPELCAAMPGKHLTFSQKAYLLPQDERWKRYTDSWLKQRQGDGTLERIMKRHLGD